jgi:hypothetical protein
VRLPDPQRSYAVLVGTSTYGSRELANLPAVRNNLDGLAQVLTDPALGGLSVERCIVLPDPTDVRTIYRTLRKYATLAEDTLLVYFAGHGRTDLRNELYLSLADTDPDELRVSALPFDVIREVLGDSPAVNRALILDCCFSGRAIPDMSGPDEAILGQVGIEGTYTLTATPATAVALAPAGATYTAFTGELITLLRTGIPNGPELLTFATIYRQLLHTLTARGLPHPRQRGTGTVDQLALTRNPALPHDDPDETTEDYAVEFKSALNAPESMIILVCIFGAAAWFIPSLLSHYWPAGVLAVLEEIGRILATRKRLIVDRLGITIHEYIWSTTNFPWSELSSIEIRQCNKKPSLVAMPKSGSILFADEQIKNEWDKHGALINFNVKSLRNSPGELNAALTRYSGGRYQTKNSSL